ncbi:MAG: Rrf2 family transcriptional regulator [Rhodospirillaceae bacterium]
MQLTKFTDYCLRVLTYLSLRNDRLVTVNEIATTYSASRHHLMKVVQHLGAKGYVESTRGKNGGIRLARKPHFISVGEVVRDCEEDFAVVECFSATSTQCPLLPACVLRTALKEATKNFLGTLDRYTLADLTTGQPSLRLDRSTRAAKRAA